MLSVRVDNCECVGGNVGQLSDLGGGSHDVIHLNHVQQAHLGLVRLANAAGFRRRAFVRGAEPNTERLTYFAPTWWPGAMGQELVWDNRAVPNMARIRRFGEPPGHNGSDGFTVHADAAGHDNGQPFIVFKGTHRPPSIGGGSGGRYNLASRLKLYWWRPRVYIKAAIHNPTTGNLDPVWILARYPRN